MSKPPKIYVSAEDESAMMQDLGVVLTLSGISYSILTEQVFLVPPYRIGVIPNESGKPFYALIRSYMDKNRIYLATAEEVAGCIVNMRGENA